MIDYRNNTKRITGVVCLFCSEPDKWFRHHIYKNYLCVQM